MIPHSKPCIGDVDIACVIAQLRSGMLAEGDMTARLENELAAHLRVRAAVATGSGTQALVLALRSLELAAGAEVILPSYVCPDVLGAVEHVGAVPCLVDIDERYALDLIDVRRRLTARTGAILLPYLFGLYRDPTPFAALGVPLIEDCAQFLPLQVDADALHGDLIVCSFETTKLLAGGEGGAVAARAPARAAFLRRLKVFEDGYKFNLYPLSDLQSTLLVSQLAGIERLLTRRRVLAARYRQALEGLSWLRLPTTSPHDVPFRCVLALQGARDDALERLIDAFAARGVAVRRPVDTLLQRFRQSGPFPGAERAYRETLSLPLYPALSDDEQDLVIAAAHELLGSVNAVRRFRA